MTGLTSQPTHAALQLRITAGILFAAARFVPVPLVDDLVRQQIAAWMVRSSVPTTMSKAAIQPLWSDESGCVGGCLGALLWLPIKLLLFPIRKILSVVLGVRWVSHDLAEMLLLGRVIDHALAVGLLQEARDVADQTRQSREIRTAFDVALKATDTSLLSALFATAIGPLRAVVAAAVRTLRALRTSGADAPTLEGSDKATIEGSVSRIEAVLVQPEVKRFLAEFDARVLENLEVLAKRRA
ncbi:hypothetical protein [Sandaracinus amylolyticus]|uniref:hypothetical protein n=1 Tax=Sandaracinus amylolyticus TaxID=927083 RepID=UPI001F31F2FA|nr:hypothetical protein [Sandaracinus amylolyticus]UJR78663.1 Hypothetical protein I5071_6940 [Sandaracinus amylolyticus]